MKPTDLPEPSEITTMCWRCNAAFPITDDKCPKCNSTNSNVDYEQAIKEMMGE